MQFKRNNSMKKQQNNSTRAWALHVALSIALLSISAVLVASSFKATPATSGLSAPIKPVAAGDKDLVIAGPASAQSLSPADAPFTFSNTGSLNTARDDHTATLLPNGKVLVAGGHNASGSLSERGTVRPGHRDLDCHRQPHHRTRYRTRRRCCPTARCWWQGDWITAAFFASAELYDPASGTWTATGSLTTARDCHTATLLPNGKVLVAGGDDNSGFLSERGTVRSGQRDLDCHRQPRHRTL